MLNLKKYFQKFSKKEKKEKPPNTKVLKQKTVNVLMVSLFFLAIFVGVLGSLRAISVTAKMDRLEKVVKDNVKESKKVKHDTELDVSRVQYYMSNFVYHYINFDRDNQEERLTKLADYYSFDTTNYLDDVKTNQVLKTQRLISVEDKKDYKLAIMRVSYQIEDRTEYRVLAIPFQMSDGLLAIISPPYFVGEELYLGKSDSFEQNVSDDLEISPESEKSDVKDFLKVFFDKYALSDETDLNLVMKEPFLMGGQFKINRINDTLALIYRENDKVVVQVSVDFEDIKTGSIHTENFTLELTKNSSGWYVEKMYHYFKN
ncbi:conjugal transfer protein [Streptococcus canis]|nr:conjugal transfer protein [Streptococcus canis]